MAALEAADLGDVQVRLTGQGFLGQAPTKQSPGRMQAEAQPGHSWFILTAKRFQSSESEQLHPEQVASWLGESRFRPYLKARDDRHEAAVALYNWNATISAAFLEVLCHLEVLLRNAIDRQFATSEPGIPLSVLDSSVWLCDPAVLTAESREKVNEAIARLQCERKRPTRDRVIASLSFGFWQALFSGVYEELWRTTLFRAFPNGSGKRREIANLAGPILHFRNRIAHHEAIFSSNLKLRHDQILRLAGIIDPEAQQYIAALSRVENLLLEMP